MPHTKKIASLAILLAFTAASGTLNIAMAESPSYEIRSQPIDRIVEHFSYMNGIDPKLALSVMQCESGGKQRNPSDFVGGKAMSNGIFSIQRETWKRWTKEMGEALDYESEFDQARVATWAIGHGYGGEFTTYVAIRKGGSYSFYSRQLKRSFTVKCRMIS